MDNFREWLSDNLRYILLGLAIILVLVLAIVAVRFVSNLNDSDNKGSGTQTESAAETETAGSTDKTETETETEEPNELVKDDPAVLAIIQSYYTAVGSKDVDTLGNMVENLDDTARQAILDNYIYESYNNIATYSKKGLEDGSYVVYSYYEVKVADVDTLVPSLSSMYLKTDENGQLYIADSTADTEASNYMSQVKAEEDVQALISDINDKYTKVVENNESLRSILDSVATPETEVAIPDSDEAGVSADKVVYATEVCNVRSDSREDADILGMLNTGDSVRRVAALDNGWSEIRYGEYTGYVRSDLLTEEEPASTEAAQ